MIIIMYETEEDMHRIVAEKTAEGYTLTAIQNISGGKFLGFEGPEWIPPEIELTIKEQVELLLNDNQIQKEENAMLLLQIAKLEDDNTKLAEDYATLILELTLKEVI